MRLSQRDLAIELRAGELGALKWARVELKGVKEQAIEGKTPEITIQQARTLLKSADTGYVVGLRDRAILATLAYITSARKLLTNRSYGVSYHLCSG